MVFLGNPVYKWSEREEELAKEIQISIIRDTENRSILWSFVKTIVDDTIAILPGSGFDVFRISMIFHLPAFIRHSSPLSPNLAEDFLAYFEKNIAKMHYTTRANKHF